MWFELLRRRPVVASRTLDAFIASFYLVGVLLAVFWWRLQVDGAEVAQYALALLGFVFWQPRYY